MKELEVIEKELALQFRLKELEVKLELTMCFGAEARWKLQILYSD